MRGGVLIVHEESEARSGGRERGVGLGGGPTEPIVLGRARQYDPAFDEHLESDCKLLAARFELLQGTAHHFMLGRRRVEQAEHDVGIEEVHAQSS